MGQPFNEFADLDISKAYGLGVDVFCSFAVLQSARAMQAPVDRALIVAPAKRLFLRLVEPPVRIANRSFPVTGQNTGIKMK